MKNALIVNTNMIKMFMAFTDDFTIMTDSLPPLILGERVSGCPYVHALLFVSKQDRDKAFQIMEKYRVDKEVKYPYVYLGEKVTQEMIDLLKENHGDFSAWEKLYNPT